MNLVRLVLVLIALCCAGLYFATPELIKPFPKDVPWYESAAMFPRAALLLAFVAACFEMWHRRQQIETSESEELDSSAAHLPTALTLCVLFALYCVLVPLLGYLSSTLLFLLAAGRVAGLSLKLGFMLAIPTALALWSIFQVVLKVAFGHGWLI